MHLLQDRVADVLNPAMEDSHVFMPSLPLLRLLPGRYRVRGRLAQLQGPCNKISNRHPKLTPGINTVFCPHGICVGFKLLASPEGPGTIHSLLATRLENGNQLIYGPQECCYPARTYWPSIAGPFIIIYDNACNLAAYCLKRTPRMFARTRFLVDRLHFSNHTT